jgi:hypothetical protein
MTVISMFEDNAMFFLSRHAKNNAHAAIEIECNWKLIETIGGGGSRWTSRNLAGNDHLVSFVI